MAIYKYTLIKYMKAKSTYIIAVISGILIGFLIGGMLPFTLINPNSSDAVATYTLTVVTSIAGVTSFLSIFASVFAGFKAASMYKDEVEDGTFLVILSKPMKRSTIIFNKWLAMQTVIFGWVVFTVVCWMIGVAAFDKGAKIDGLGLLGVDTVTSQLPKIGGFVLLILFVTALIFSSIALLLSTKLSVSATTGISIALGIIIPITSLVGAFTKKDEFKVLRNSELSSQQRQANILGKTFSPMEDLAKEINDFTAKPSMQSIYKLGISTGNSNPYSAAWIVDLNYQINQLSSFAYEQAIPAAAKEYAENSRTTSSGAPGQGSNRIKGIKDIVTSQVVQDFNVSPIVKNTKDIFDSYFGGIDGMANDSLSRNFSDISIKSLESVFNFVMPADVTISNNDRILLENIGSSSAATAANKLDWLTKLNQPNFKITTQNILDLLHYVYGNEQSSDGTMGANFTKLLDYTKYETTSTAQDGDWLRYKANGLAKTLVNALAAAKLNFVSNAPTSINLNEIIKTFGSAVEKMNSPFTSLFINESNLTDGANDFLSKEFVSSIDGTKITYEQAAREVLTDANSSLLGYTKFLPSKDVDALTRVVASSLANRLSEVESVQYVNKNGLLAAYIIIALALVPLAYFVVKKQDFR